MRAESAPLCQALEAPPVATLDQIGQLAAALHVLGQAPHGDLRCLAAPEWEMAVGELRTLVQTGAQLATEAASLGETVTDAAWSVDVALTRTHLAAHGRSFFRFLSGDYRRARALVRGLSKSKPPGSVDGCIALLDALASAQRLRVTVAGAHGLGARTFGGQWQGEASHWEHLTQLVSWAEMANQQDPSGRARRAAARIGSAQAAVVQAVTFGQRVAALRTAFDNALARLQFDAVEAFNVRDVAQVPLNELRARLSQWIEAPLFLDRWTSYIGAVTHLGALQLGTFIPPIAMGTLAPTAFVPQLITCFYEEALRRAFERYPVLNAFDGNAHARAIDRFQTLDRERLRMARYEVCLAHARTLPNQQGDGGEMGLLRKQMSKKRGIMPLRQLIQQAGKIIQTIKPVFMMSPISVAQFLKPGAVEFDLLLIDEASQVAPVDALGAIARCQQIVVVGDEKQLPPTSFFQRMATSEEDTDEDTLADTPSILKLCEGQGLPQRMLRWHYRSRHHSLIAVSNREFYDGRLFIPPSPEQAGAATGLRFHHVADGVFDRGNTARNPREARVVVEHILAHARETPEKSLGVGTFSMAQRDAINEALEPARKAHPELEPFCAPGGQDGFFVKNLESIQGDEREVIFISVGYGRDSSGFMSMSFGPLNNDGGERRLNVLITRARSRCEVFSSITADDIDPKKTSARGVVALKRFLHCAATGIEDIGIPTEKGFGSPFEEQVARAVQRHGYAVHSQVGVAGFFIDLAVPHPEQPGRYLLGIECDGAQYHSSRCARDRDRLRQQVLEDRGWTIARVWSTDWFRDPDRQTKKLVDALAAVRAKPHGARPIARKPEPQPELARHAPASVAPPPLLARYVEASFATPATPIHDLRRDDLAEIVWRILEVEAPVHRDEIAKRITSLWGLSRTGGRIAGAVDDALHLLQSRKRTLAEGDFFSIPGKRVIPRDRAGAASTSLRKAEYLPSAEIHAALRTAVSSNQGIDEERLLVEALHLLGFKTIGQQVRAVALAQLQALCRSNTFERREGRLYLAKEPT